MALTAPSTLNIQFSVCVKFCKRLLVYDKTGLFHAIQNPGGWTPTLLLAVVSDNLQITFPDGHIITVSLIDATIPFPSSNTNDYKMLVDTALGLPVGSSLPAGKWSFTRTVVYIDPHNGNTMQTVQKMDYWIVCQVMCCVEKMKRKTKDIDPCCKTNKFKNDADTAWDKMEAAQLAFECGDYNAAKCLLDQAQALCREHGCDTC